MKRILIVAASLLALAAFGCKHQVAATPPCPACAAAQKTANAPPAPAQAFQPYNLVNQAAPIPAVATHRNRYLHIAQRGGQPYLCGADGRYYHIGRDLHGHIYPAYYDNVTQENYPLYYDSSRDRYYRMLRRENRYYMNFVDDSSNEYYECDRDENYSYYDPPREDCPVIWDGSFSFTIYNEAGYYIEPNRYYGHWRDDYWLDDAPIFIGAYFVLNDYADYGPAWYYGYQNNNQGERWAYRQDNRGASVSYYQGGRRMTGNFSVTPPASAMVPRKDWARDAQVYGNHRSPSRAWGNDSGQRAQVAAGRTENRGAEAQRGQTGSSTQRTATRSNNGARRQAASSNRARSENRQTAHSNNVARRQTASSNRARSENRQAARSNNVARRQTASSNRARSENRQATRSNNVARRSGNQRSSERSPSRVARSPRSSGQSQARRSFSGGSQSRQHSATRSFSGSENRGGGGNRGGGPQRNASGGSNRGGSGQRNAGGGGNRAGGGQNHGGGGSANHGGGGGNRRASR
jgi:hypothetical protein